jgi:two-component system CheB/CheR fusion protein
LCAVSSGSTPTKDALRGVRVLVVDDSFDSRRIMQRILAVAGADVALAETGAQAWVLLAGGTPHVILCDLAMPEIDGYGFVRELRAHPTLHAVPAVAVTSFPEHEIERECKAAGFDDRIAKSDLVRHLVPKLVDLLRKV